MENNIIIRDLIKVRGCKVRCHTFPNSAHPLCHFLWVLTPEMQKAADAADISVLFFSAGANFWAILGHFWAISAILGHFWANLGNFGSYLGYFG